MNSSTKNDQQFLNIYFQVHQPRRLKRFRFFDVGSGTAYFDDALNREILCRIANECYLPANKMLLRLIERFPQVRFTFSVSGVALGQMERFAPSVLRSFRQLAETGAVEFLAETYHHSLAYFIDHDEFIVQIAQHRDKLAELLGVYPQVFRNTELIYSDGIGRTVADLGFKGMFIDGIPAVLNGRTPNTLYRHPSSNLVLFPRNFQLSDDIAFRYSDRNWTEWPLTGDKFAGWLHAIPADEKLVNLAMDYETFGEHKKADSGIFGFFDAFISQVASHDRFSFVTPSSAIKLLPSPQIVSTEKAISWADEARDLSAWLGNDMQRDAFDSLYKFHDVILQSGDEALISAYRHLQTSDHFYYMSTKKDNDGNVHQYFSPYESPYEAFMNFMNVISDLELKVKQELKAQATLADLKSEPSGAAFSRQRIFE